LTDGRDLGEAPLSLMKIIGAHTDIQVESQDGDVVRIFAKAVGREVVECLFPDVEWGTDDTFASVDFPDWMVTQIRVTKLPEAYHSLVPAPPFSPDALGFAVGTFIRRLAGPGRVCYWNGLGEDGRLQVSCIHDLPQGDGKSFDLQGKYLPPRSGVAEK
jgi:hypothetical protein